MIHALGHRTSVEETERETPEMSRTDLAIMSLGTLAFGLALIVRGLWPHGG
jgi:hypothetical protein